MIFSLMIMAIMANFYVSWIFIDWGSLCNIMYAELFGKDWLKGEKLWSCERSNLQTFNVNVTRLWEYIELMITLGEESDVSLIDLQLLVILYRSLYKCILGIPFATMLDVMVSLLHLKINYHNIHKKLVKYLSNFLEHEWYTKSCSTIKKGKRKGRQWRLM